MRAEESSALCTGGARVSPAWQALGQCEVGTKTGSYVSCCTVLWKVMLTILYNLEGTHYNNWRHNPIRTTLVRPLYTVKLISNGRGACVSKFQTPSQKGKFPRAAPPSLDDVSRVSSCKCDSLTPTLSQQQLDVCCISTVQKASHLSRAQIVDCIPPLHHDYPYPQRLLLAGGAGQALSQRA